MRIRSKIILVVLPLIVGTLILVGASSYFTAINGINRATERFLGFKADELRKYAENQWTLLVENNYAGRSDMVAAAENAVWLYARSIITSASEVILAVNEEGAVEMTARAGFAESLADPSIEISDEETAALIGLLNEENSGVMNASIGGVQRVFRAFYFTPFG